MAIASRCSAEKQGGLWHCHRIQWGSRDWNVIEQMNQTSPFGLSRSVRHNRYSPNIEVSGGAGVT